MKKNLLFFGVSFTVLLSACGPGSGEGEGEAQGESVDTTTEVSHENVVYYAAPSPMEVVNMIETTDVPFNGALMNAPSKVSNYTTTVKKATNLGVYGADLSYVALFDQTQKSRDYLNVIKGLSDELGMTGAFEKDFLTQLEKNIANRDSLLRIISQFYWDADTYLSENERSVTSALMAAGGWVEGMYLSTQIAKKNGKNTEAMVQRIAEQKLTLKNLVLLLKLQGSENLDAAEIISGLEGIKASFEAVEISYSAPEVETKDDAGMTRVGGSSNVTISPENLAEITGKIEQLRALIVN
ncbi:MAG: hypothetical protein KDD36_10235 [Flavobacteriales bacterium]|nr:hypothetical protein [Flavobacteriales bacterium]